MPAGIDIRHRKHCTSPRDDGKCCGASFQAYVYDKRTGKLIRHTEPTITGAKQWRQDALVALRRGEYQQPAAGRTVTAAMTELLAGMRDGTVLDRSGRRYRPATIRSYGQAWRKYLEPALGRLRLGEVQRRDVQRLIDRMHADKLSGSTIRNKLDPLRVLYRRALEDEEVTRTPISSLRLPENTHAPRTVVDAGQAGVLLDALPDAERALFAAALYAGLRIGELRALRWTAVDFDAGVIRVHAGWDDQEGEQDTKTLAGTRTVPLAGRLRAELARHKLATGHGEDDLVFGRTGSSAFTRSTVRARALRAWGWKEAHNPEPDGPKLVWLKAREDALEPLTPHQARHCAASYMAACGLTPKEAQTALGHADIRTTMNVYAKAVPGWEQGAAAKLDAYLGAKVLRKSGTQPSGS
jgi:integrase